MKNVRIKIVLNGEDFSISANSNIEMLLKELELVPKGIAVELNREIVPKSQYSTTKLKGKDKLEIVQMVGGG